MFERYAAIGYFGSIPFVQGGFILEFCPDWSDTLVYQMSASVFQPLMGLFFDKRPIAWSLPIGMGFTLVGIMNLAFATNLYWLLASVFIVGIGSSVLHPEASVLLFWLPAENADWRSLYFRWAGIWVARLDRYWWLCW